MNSLGIDKMSGGTGTGFVRRPLRGTDLETGLLRICEKHGEIVESAYCPNDFSLSVTTAVARPRINFRQETDPKLMDFQKDLEDYVRREDLQVEYVTLKRAVVYTPRS